MHLVSFQASLFESFDERMREQRNEMHPTPPSSVWFSGFKCHWAKRERGRHFIKFRERKEILAHRGDAFHVLMGRNSVVLLRGFMLNAVGQIEVFINTVSMDSNKIQQVRFQKTIGRGLDT